MPKFLVELTETKTQRFIVVALDILTAKEYSLAGSNIHERNISTITKYANVLQRITEDNPLDPGWK